MISFADTQVLSIRVLQFGQVIKSNAQFQILCEAIDKGVVIVLDFQEDQVCIYSTLLVLRPKRVRSTGADAASRIQDVERS